MKQQDKQLNDFQKIVILKHAVRNAEKELSKVNQEKGIITSERDESYHEISLLKVKISNLEFQLDLCNKLDKSELKEVQKNVQVDKIVQSLELRHKDHLRIIKNIRLDNRNLIAKISGLEKQIQLLTK